MAYEMGSEALDFTAYDLDEALNYFAPSSAAAEPVRKPAKEKKPVTVKGRGLEKEVDREAQVVAVNKYAKQAAAVFALLVFCSFVLLGIRAQCNDLDRKIAEINVEIGNQASETVRLNSELNAMLSSEKIEKYAAEHGMIKAESYQVTYIDLSDGDKVVVSGEKSVEKANSFSQKIADLFAYIF